MQTFDQSLLGLYKRRASSTCARRIAASTTPHDLRLMIEQFTMKQAREQQAAAGSSRASARRAVSRCEPLAASSRHDRAALE